jgi:hypothetical protein
MAAGMSAQGLFAVFRLSTNSTLHRPHERQIGRLLALEDTCGIDANLYKRTSRLLAASTVGSNRGSMGVGDPEQIEMEADSAG